MTTADIPQLCRSVASSRNKGLLVWGERVTSHPRCGLQRWSPAARSQCPTERRTCPH